MSKIFSQYEDLKPIEKISGEPSNIVLVGGCFDILHIGHINFLKAAKKQGHTLIVLLESDEAIQKYKGPKRPINQQKNRAEILAELKSVDFIILLKGVLTDKDYDALVKKIKPAIIATTAQDPHLIHKKRQAKLTGAKVVDVINPVKGTSTTKIAQLLENEL